jgi:hypothetical protein
MSTHDNTVTPDIHSPARSAAVMNRGSATDR